MRLGSDSSGSALPKEEMTIVVALISLTRSLRQQRAWPMRTLTNRPQSICKRPIFKGVKSKVVRVSTWGVCVCVCVLLTYLARSGAPCRSVTLLVSYIRWMSDEAHFLIQFFPEEQNVHNCEAAIGNPLFLYYPRKLLLPYNEHT